MITTVIVNTRIYTDTDVRNWLAIRGCQISWTMLGELAISFAGPDHLSEFYSLWPQYRTSALTS